MQSITEEQLDALQPIIAKRSELIAMKRLLQEKVEIEVTVRTKRDNVDHNLQFRLGIANEDPYHLSCEAIERQLENWIKRAEDELRHAGFVIGDDGALSVATTHAAPEAAPAEQADTNEA